MVFAVRCPNPKCRKYQLVEDHDRGKVVKCLICKEPIQIPASVAVPSPHK
jgi:ribosomal protein S27E